MTSSPRRLLEHTPPSGSAGRTFTRRGEGDQPDWCRQNPWLPVHSVADQDSNLHGLPTHALVLHAHLRHPEGPADAQSHHVQGQADGLHEHRHPRETHHAHLLARALRLLTPSEYLEALQLVAWCKSRPDLKLVRIPNASTSAQNWRKQCAEGAEKGCADYVFLLRGGRSAAWELKSRVGKLRPDQKIWLAAVNDLGIPSGFGTAAQGISIK